MRRGACAAGAASLREIAFSLKNPFARGAATSSARSLDDFTLERPLPGPYAILSKAQNRPQTPDGFARLRSTSQLAASGLQEFILQTALTSARGLATA